MFVDDPFPTRDRLITVVVTEAAMGPTLFVMVIMGCGDADAACRQVRVADALYATTKACEAATPAVLGRNTDLDFPVVEARCRAERADTARALQAEFPRG